MAVGPDHPIAREIRAARAYSGKSRKQLGDAIGVSSETVGNWERGDFTRPMTQPVLGAIAKFAQVLDCFEFVTESPPATPSVAERAKAAARRLDGTPSASSETGDVLDAGDEDA